MATPTETIERFKRLGLTDQEFSKRRVGKAIAQPTYKR